MIGGFGSHTFIADFAKRIPEAARIAAMGLAAVLAVPQDAVHVAEPLPSAIVWG